MDSLKFHLGPPCPTLLRPAAVFYPFNHPIPYAYTNKATGNETTLRFHQCTMVWNIKFQETWRQWLKTHPGTPCAWPLTTRLQIVGWPWVRNFGDLMFPENKRLTDHNTLSSEIFYFWEKIHVKTIRSCPGTLKWWLPAGLSASDKVFRVNSFWNSYKHHLSYCSCLYTSDALIAGIHQRTQDVVKALPSSWRTPEFLKFFLSIRFFMDPIWRFICSFGNSSIRHIRVMFAKRAEHFSPSLMPMKSGMKNDGKGGNSKD
jgi:hypothetical protein